MNKLTSIVGNNQDSKPEDVKTIRNKLNLLGIESGDEDRGYIDQNLDTSIRVFQRGMNLKEDGIIQPNGETDIRLNHTLELIKKGKITPPRPQHKPLSKSPPLPGRKEDALFKRYAKDRANLIGDVGAEFISRGIKRLPARGKLGKAIKGTTQKGEKFISKTISNIFDDYFEYVINEQKNEEKN